MPALLGRNDGHFLHNASFEDASDRLGIAVTPIVDVPTISCDSGPLAASGTLHSDTVREAIEDERWSDVETYAVLIGKALTAYSDRIDEGVALINSTSAPAGPPRAK